jgi:hypothetical protein
MTFRGDILLTFFIVNLNTSAAGHSNYAVEPHSDPWVIRYRLLPQILALPLRLQANCHTDLRCNAI